jgi:hypothetical protein
MPVGVDQLSHGRSGQWRSGGLDEEQAAVLAQPAAADRLDPEARCSSALGLVAVARYA